MVGVVIVVVVVEVMVMLPSGKVLIVGYTLAAYLHNPVHNGNRI